MTPLNPPIVPRKTYLGIWVILLLLLLLNWGLARIDLGVFNLVASLAIAAVQTLLMLLYLMHVRYNTPLTRIFVAAGFIWLMIMLDLTLSDYLTRGSVPGMMRKSWEHGAWPAPTEELPGPTPAAPPAQERPKPLGKQVGQQRLVEGSATRPSVHPRANASWLLPSQSQSAARVC